MLRLEPIGPCDLETVAPWFEDGDTRRWLGDADWPRLGLKLSGPRRQSYLALNGDLAVGLLDVESYPYRRASFANVIAPQHRGKGFGTSLIAAMIAEPALDDIDEFFAGVEHGNIASERLLKRCGFRAVTDEDSDGFTYFALRRRGTFSEPWTLPD